MKNTTVVYTGLLATVVIFFSPFIALADAFGIPTIWAFQSDNNRYLIQDYQPNWRTSGDCTNVFTALGAAPYAFNKTIWKNEVRVAVGTTSHSGYTLANACDLGYDSAWVVNPGTATSTAGSGTYRVYYVEGTTTYYNGSNAFAYMEFTYDAGSGQVTGFNGSIFQGVTDSDLVAEIASTSVFGGGNATSTLEAMKNTCNQEDNIFGKAVCIAFATLFMPSTATIDNLFSTLDSAKIKFPFSWIYGIQTTYNSLAVSSSSAMTTLSFNLGSLGIGSTSPMGNILPNTEVFSKNTIETYISPTLWATFQTLIAAAMWLGFIWFEFNRARHLAKPH